MVDLSKYFEMYPLDEIILPETIFNDSDSIINKWGEPIQTHVTWQRVEDFGQRHKEAVQAYLAATTFVDDCIGVLLDGLEQSPYSENTMVVLRIDHGWHLGEKQCYGKTQLWQEATRIPLMIKVPGVTPSNKKCMGVVSLIDLYPTLLELCGLPANAENEGRSFAELIYNPDMVWDEPILADYNYGQRIYDGRFSYITFSNSGTEELYDHKEDPMEWRNLAQNPEYVKVKERLKAYLPTEREPVIQEE